MLDSLVSNHYFLFATQSGFWDLHLFSFDCDHVQARHAVSAALLNHVCSDLEKLSWAGVIALAFILWELIRHGLSLNVLSHHLSELVSCELSRRWELESSGTLLVR